MAWPVTRRAVLVALTTIAAGCTGLPGQRTPAPTDNPAFGTVSQMGDLQLTTSAFEAGGAIPKKYGKAHQNVNPPLSIGGVPDDATSLALIVDDPDAPGGTFSHWLVWNRPPHIGTIPEGWTPPERAVQGTNDFGNGGYDGPKPPSKHLPVQTFRVGHHHGRIEQRRQRGAWRRHGRSHPGTDPADRNVCSIARRPVRHGGFWPGRLRSALSTVD